jgi:prepilin-type N-terminal cleavage/methylation domain-containing protein
MSRLAEDRVRTHGITLIEVLIVVAIIAVLVQLSLPAVQMASESARRAQCQNNLRQLGQGFLLHENTHGHFPTGGWGYLWVGDPDRGYGKNQPGGWAYNVLPYVEEATLHDLGGGQTTEAKLSASQSVLATAVPLFYCPSRRQAKPYAFDHSERPYRNYQPPDKVGKSDYAACGGDWFPETGYDFVGPESFAQFDERQIPWSEMFPDRDQLTGITYAASATRVVEVTDGLSNTYLIGEKGLDPLRYTKNNTTPGDDLTMYNGYTHDTIRWAGHFEKGDLPPERDAKNDVLNDDRFGSAHPTGLSFVFGDGSVQFLAYDIDPELHKRRANKADQQVTATTTP